MLRKNRDEISIYPEHFHLEFFAFLCVLASWREPVLHQRDCSRKGAKAQRNAKKILSILRHTSHTAKLRVFINRQISV